MSELAGTTDDAMLRSADLLETALDYLADYPSDDCPVCGTEGAVDAEWQLRAREQVDEQRRVAKIAQRERKRLQAARPNRTRPARDVPAAVQDAQGSPGRRAGDRGVATMGGAG